MPEHRVKLSPAKAEYVDGLLRAHANALEHTRTVELRFREAITTLAKGEAPDGCQFVRLDLQAQALVLSSPPEKVNGD